MGLLDAGAEEPKSKALRYVISGVVLALLLGASVWYFLRYTTEKRTVEHFMHGFPQFLGTERLLQPDQDLSDRERGSAAQGWHRRGDRCRDQRVRSVS
jgi:hypothetical protein